MLHDEFRTHRLTVSRSGRTSDGAGGWVAALSTVDTVEGSLQPLGGAELVVGGAERAEARWQLFLDPRSGVQRDDVLTVVAERNGASWATVTGGRALLVLFVDDWRDGGALDHDAVQLVEVQRGR